MNDYNSDYPVSDSDDDLDQKPSSSPTWYRSGCKYSLWQYHSFCERKDRESAERRGVETLWGATKAKAVSALPPLAESWTYYQELLRQQRDILNSQAHVHVLETAISSFPALRRITITHATHGELFRPFYETPMVRAFPHGFRYPIPWRGSEPYEDFTEPGDPDWDDSGSHWRGLRAVMRILARNKDLGRVSELRIDTGFNVRLFEKSYLAANDFEAVVARPNFKHLHLDLMENTSARNSDLFYSNLLKRALAGAAGGQGLEHLSFRAKTNLDIVLDNLMSYVPLDTLLQPDCLSRLRHFNLSHIIVEQDDLLALLASLPRCLRAIELDSLNFIEGSYRTLLWRIRDTLSWRDRSPQPTLSIRVDIDRGCVLLVEEEVDMFLYHDGSNPFVDDPAAIGDEQVEKGIGIIKDTLDPEYERPNKETRTFSYTARVGGGNLWLVSPTMW